MANSFKTEWSYSAPTTGILTNTTSNIIKAAGTGTNRNYLTTLQIQADALTVATEILIKNGVGGPVLWRIKIGTSGLFTIVNIVFPTPLKSSANTPLEIVTGTTTVGEIYVNAQGYQAQ